MVEECVFRPEKAKVGVVGGRDNPGTVGRAKKNGEEGHIVRKYARPWRGLGNWVKNCKGQR